MAIPVPVIVRVSTVACLLLPRPYVSVTVCEIGFRHSPKRFQILPAPNRSSGKQKLRGHAGCDMQFRSSDAFTKATSFKFDLVNTRGHHEHSSPITSDLRASFTTHPRQDHTLFTSLSGGSATLRLPEALC